MLLETCEWGNPDGPPVVLVHGVGSHAGSWRKVVDERWGKRFRIIAFDLRGHGRSGWEPPWTHATYVDDLLESVDALGLDRPDWVGRSFGGRLMLDLAARAPERIRRLALLEPVVRIPAELARHRAEQELTGGEWDSFEQFVASRENLGPDVDVEKFKAELADEFDTLPDGRLKRRTSQAAVVSIFSEFAAPAPPPETLRVPAMLLYAPAFGLVTPEQLEAYRPYLEQVVEVPGLHQILTTAFDETADAVEKFLLAP
ncbi:alpha/beta fold hydrolase [Amycolatopsis sp. NPDC003676]